MVIEVGETVVYPHHGAATITKMTMRTIKGVDTQYVKLKMHEGDLVVELPVENFDEVGVRDVIGRADVEAVYDVLRSDTVEEPGIWSRRFKANTEKMGSGDVLRISEVVRDLWRRDRRRVRRREGHAGQGPAQPDLQTPAGPAAHSRGDRDRARRGSRVGAGRRLALRLRPPVPIAPARAVADATHWRILGVGAVSPRYRGHPRWRFPDWP